jgi:hypothetical protein
VQPYLVLIMDESHRYRAMAGVRAINELKPVKPDRIAPEKGIQAWADRKARADHSATGYQPKF